MSTSSEIKRKINNFAQLVTVIAIAFGGGVIYGATHTPNQETNYSPIATTSPAPEKLGLPLTPQNCVTIGPDSNTAYGAWEKLDKPPEVDFYNIAGPDATPNPKRLTFNELPDLVNPGDRFCKP